MKVYRVTYTFTVTAENREQAKEKFITAIESLEEEDVEAVRV